MALAARGVVARVQGWHGVRSCAVTLSDAQNGRRAARGGRASERVRRTPQDAPERAEAGQQGQGVGSVAGVVELYRMHRKEGLNLCIPTKSV